MIDHASISVKNYKDSLKFYDETFALLGYPRIITLEFDGGQAAAYGKDQKPSFWISPDGIEKEDIGKARGVHFSFSAESAEQVNAWYKKCLELGAKDNGAPGPRKEYHPGYYGAFVIDPDGWRIEACLHHYTF